jgi:hypothetical protein
LLNKVSTHREIEDGLSECLDLVGACGKWFEGIQGKSRMIAEALRVRGGLIQAGQTCRR